MIQVTPTYLRDHCNAEKGEKRGTGKMHFWASFIFALFGWLDEMDIVLEQFAEIVTVSDDERIFVVFYTLVEIEEKTSRMPQNEFHRLDRSCGCCCCYLLHRRNQRRHRA